MSLPRREPTEAAKMAWGVYNDGFAPATAQEHEIKRAFLDGYQDAEDARQPEVDGLKAERDDYWKQLCAVNIDNDHLVEEPDKEP
jgi:hypothetical protein